MELVHGLEDYSIDLADINNSAQALDWIMQAHGNNSFGAADIYNLLTALDSIFEFQVNYCSDGISKEANGAELVQRYVNPN